MKLEETFGICLRELRTAAGLSQEKLAGDSGLDRTYISLLERGLRQPSLTTVFLLSRALDVRPEEFVLMIDKEFQKNKK